MTDWVRVPREATPEMTHSCDLDDNFEWQDRSAFDVWAECVAASPDPAEDEGLVERLARVLARQAAADCVPGIAAAEYEDRNWREWEFYARAILTELRGKS